MGKYSKEIKGKLIKGMEQSFEKYAFIYDKKEVAYSREINNGSQTYYFLITERSDGVYIEPRWSIQLKDILDIYNQVTVKDKEFLIYTPVLGNSLGQLIEYVDEKNERGSGKKMQYLAEKEEDIEILKKVIPLRFEEYVLPYFNMNSTVARVDELLNTHPQELVIHQWLNPHRAIIGVIAAKLNNNPRLDDLLHIYGEKFEKAAPNYQREFENLIRFLRGGYN